MSKSFKMTANTDQAVMRVIRCIYFVTVTLLVSSCDQPMQANTPHNPKFDDPKLAAESLRDPEKFFRGMTIGVKDLGSPATYPGGWVPGTGALAKSKHPEGFSYAFTVVRKNEQRVLIVEASKPRAGSNYPINIVDAKRMPKYSLSETFWANCRHPEHLDRSTVAIVGNYSRHPYRRLKSNLWQDVSCMHESESVRLAWTIDPSTGAIHSVDPQGVVCANPGTYCVDQ